VPRSDSAAAAESEAEPAELGDDRRPPWSAAAARERERRGLLGQLGRKAGGLDGERVGVRK
jgi:hypothetical protein